ncbi:MAG: hypothetical protein ACLGH8_02325 [Bacteroidia bacterium]
METIHLRVNSKVYEHVMWLLKQFDRNDVEIVSEEFLRNKAELEEDLRKINAGEMKMYSLEEFEKETDELLKKHEG